MSEERLLNTKPLIDISRLFGQDDFDWAIKEQRWSIECEFAGLDFKVLSTLTPEPFNACVDIYGDSITASGFYTEDMGELDCKNHISQEDLDALAKIVERDDSLIFRFKLDKYRLLENWYGPGTDKVERYLYLFEHAFITYLQACSLGDLEKLWNNAPEKKVLVLLPNCAFTCDGELLAVLGGEEAKNWHTYVPEDDFDKYRIDSITEIRKNFSMWEKPWVDFLTPLHLRVEQLSNSRITNLLSAHWINLILIYTAGRVTGYDQELTAHYAGTQQSVQVNLIQPQDACLEIADEGRRRGMQEIWAWAYDPAFAPDRLQFVQIVVAQYLMVAEQEIRCNLLLHNAQEILHGLKWHWQAFVEKKIEGYTTQVRELEEYVDRTIEVYGNQISDMIRSLSETILTAIAAFLGTFIVSLFRENVDFTIFITGMVVYAVYVYIFPYQFRYKNQMERFAITKEGFEKRRAEFERYLYKTRVKEIVKDRIVNSEERFTRWAIRVKIAYSLTIILVLTAAYFALILGVFSFFVSRLFNSNPAMLV